jgi:elongation factor Tu
LNSYKFCGNDILIIRGSTLCALHGINEDINRKSILKLVGAMDEYILDPVSELAKPFLMSIADVFSVEDQGTVAAGSTENESIEVGDEVDIIGI